MTTLNWTKTENNGWKAESTHGVYTLERTPGKWLRLMVNGVDAGFPAGNTLYKMQELAESVHLAAVAKSEQIVPESDPFERCVDDVSHGVLMARALSPEGKQNLDPTVPNVEPFPVAPPETSSAIPESTTASVPNAEPSPVVVATPSSTPDDLVGPLPPYDAIMENNARAIAGESTAPAIDPPTIPDGDDDSTTGDDGNPDPNDPDLGVPDFRVNTAPMSFSPAKIDAHAKVPDRMELLRRLRDTKPRWFKMGPGVRCGSAESVYKSGSGTRCV